MDGSGQFDAGGFGVSERIQITDRSHQVGFPADNRMAEAKSTGLGDWCRGWDSEFAELTLLMPNSQLEVLEKAAFGLGITTGQLLRGLIRNCLAGLDDAVPSKKPVILGADGAADNAGFVRDGADNEP